MLFLNTILLLGALGILIPIIIHLLNRRSSKVVEWGAMNFLIESLAIRNRRIQLEEALLMACRCLLVGLLALAIARPFIPPGSSIPWVIVLPLLLIAIVGIGVAVVLNNEPKWRRIIGISSVVLLLLCVALIFLEKYLNLSRFSPSARQDIALVIDGSTSMSLSSDGVTNFERAVEEARTIVKRAPRGHAFSLILGGPSPNARILDPTTDRAELEAALDDLRPLDGAMASYQALTLASLSLTRGDHSAKQIILFTDGQNVGWEIGKSGRWNFLRDAFKNLPSEPQVMMRRMPLPQHLRNLAITDVSLSREIVGIDRQVEVSVTVENTGNEAVTPSGLSFRTDGGREYFDRSLGQMQPGEKHRVQIWHQFSEPGATAIEVSLEVEDDILADNRGATAINVANELSVLIVDGNATGRLLERGATFTQLALAPSSLTLNPQLSANTPEVSDDASDDFDAYYDPTLDPIQFLVAPQVLTAAELTGISDFGSYDVIMLVDVPRLNGASADAIARFVEGGGGLLVAPGPRVQPEFYNSWETASASPLLPVEIGSVVVAPDLDSRFRPSPRTLAHPVLQKFAEAGKSDFADTLLGAYRQQVVPESLARETAVGARLNNGDILLSSRPVGDGSVIVSGLPLAPASGNLVTRQAFLPVLHELTYHLANPAAYNLNLDPGWEVNLALTGKGGRSLGEGLIGNYFVSHSAQEPVFTRQDSEIRFNWLNGSPAPGVPKDGFRIEWQGRFQVPKTGRYTFSADADDRLVLHIDNRKVLDVRYPGGSKHYSRKLEAGQWYEIEITHFEDGSDSKVALYYETEGMSRRLIPSSAFNPFRDGEAGVAANTGDPSAPAFPVTAPDGSTRSAVLGSSGGMLQLQGDISSGLYRLEVPEDQTPFFSEFLRPESSTIPFTVRRDNAESQLMSLTSSDEAFLANFITIAEPQTLEELVGFLSGNQFGQELWKYLAVGAFLFLLIEIVLSRWISRSRRLDEDIPVTFESKDAPTTGFREQLAQMGRGKGPSVASH
ncbi:MAG: PA14 domain-containing protein [Verrucomicrobiota bacterium]